MRAPADIHIVEGADADTLLGDDAFVQEWRALMEATPWATGFQRPEFALAWYRTYANRARPLLVHASTPTRGLYGLLALAVTADGEIIAAGGRQAEYQCWLARPGDEAEFPMRALSALQPRLTRSPLQLQYLPADVPLDWLTDSSLATARIDPVERPLMALSADDIEQSWRKKSNKSRLNRLAKTGELSFERVQSVDELQAILPEITRIYDLRQASISGEPPFLADPNKAALHLELLKTTGLLHVTVLRAGSTLVSAHLGMLSPGMAHIGILAHSPFFARHSPGKLHVMFLARQLVSEGTALLDLTPGDDPWKARSASMYDRVRRLTIFSSVSELNLSQRRARLKSKVKSVVTSAGVSPERARAFVAALKEKSAPELMRAASRRAVSALPRTVELRAYSMALPPLVPTADRPAKRDSVEDLLLFHPGPETLPVAEFYRVALSRLEQGHHCYTIVQHGRLVHFGWLTEHQNRGMLEEVHQLFTYPPESVALYDFFTDPEFRGKGLYRRTMAQMLSDAAQSGHKRAFIFVVADNHPSRRAIEKAGFTYELSLYERSAFGRSRKWRSDGPVEQPAAESADQSGDGTSS